MFFFYWSSEGCLLNWSLLLQDLGLGKRLLACVLAALKAEDCTGVHCEISTTNTSALDFYTKIGFHNIPVKEQLPPDTTILGRTFWKQTSSLVDDYLSGKTICASFSDKWVDVSALVVEMVGWKSQWAQNQRPSAEQKGKGVWGRVDGGECRARFRVAPCFGEWAGLGWVMAGLGWVRNRSLQKSYLESPRSSNSSVREWNYGVELFLGTLLLRGVCAFQYSAKRKLWFWFCALAISRGERFMLAICILAWKFGCPVFWCHTLQLPHDCHHWYDVRDFVGCSSN